jgi:putative ABC transport system permease protein
MQVIVALGVPIVAGLLPILRATQTTIREALSSYGIQASRFGNNIIDRLVEFVRFLPRPLLISLRNTFRRKARLLLTLSGLTLAGAMFLAVMNLRGSMNLAIDDALGYLLSDVNVSFAGFYRMEELKPWLDNTPEIDYYESWGIQTADLLVSGDLVSTQVLIFAPPAGSRMIEPTMTSGRWLLPGDNNGIVIGNHLQAARPELKVGDEVVIKFSNGKETRWKIVGSYIMAGNVNPPIVYTNAEDLAVALGQVKRVSQLRIQTNQHDTATQQRVADALEIAFEKADIQVSQVLTGDLVTRQNTAQIDLLVIFMIVMAGLLALVGGLGLASTMSMNVIERTREIGVIRAIGAGNSDVMQLVIVEGVLIGLLSFLLAAIFAIPIGLVLTNLIGIAILQAPLDFIMASEGYLIWLGVVIVLSTLASFAPARSATRLTVREILAYE